MFFEKNILPCAKRGTCPYEYGKGSDRDIEGMPFSKKNKDKRSCPNFGHICPSFMEKCGLSVDDLKIRATIHCGLVASDMLDNGRWKLADMDDAHRVQVQDLLERFRITKAHYPIEEYPKYY